MNEYKIMGELYEIYRDQAMKSEACIFTAYTPDGIRKIDSLFCKRITSFKRGEPYVEYSYNYSTKPPTKEVENIWADTVESLTNDIKNNPHLHDKIKENLLFNLTL